MKITFFNQGPNFCYHVCYGQNVNPQNSHIEALTTNVIVFEDKA